MKLNYEKVIQWVAGPVAIGAGWLAAQLYQHVNLGAFGVSKAQTAIALGKAGVFIVGAGVTYAAHHKWLDNVNKVVTTFGTRADTSVQDKVKGP